MRRGFDGDTDPVWVMAHTQTGGRGRSGRGWVSMPGNLHASLLLRPGCSLASAAQLSLVAGVAAIDAIREAAAPATVAGLRVKWPNDILIADAKMGGILIESTVQGANAELIAVIGVGLNLAASPDDPVRKTTHLREHLGAHLPTRAIGDERGDGRTIAPRAMLDRLASAMQLWLGHWDHGHGFKTIRDAWLERAGQQGESMTLNTGHGPVAGIFLGIDDDGALLMRDRAGRECRYTFGDVTLPGEGRDAG